MSLFFRKIDALPLVRLLQAAAVLLLAFGLLQIAQVWYQPFRTSFDPTPETFASALVLTGMMAGRLLFEPLILLALAEIVRQRRQGGQEQGGQA